jgi:hypothetical protein
MSQRMSTSTIPGARPHEPSPRAPTMPTIRYTRDEEGCARSLPRAAWRPSPRSRPVPSRTAPPTRENRSRASRRLCSEPIPGLLLPSRSISVRGIPSPTVCAVQNMLMFDSAAKDLNHPHETVHQRPLQFHSHHAGQSAGCCATTPRTGPGRRMEPGPASRVPIAPRDGPALLASPHQERLRGHL